jgi:Tfp pilus assembly protein PilF
LFTAAFAQEWAVAESEAKNFSAARQLFGRALALNPRHVPALAALARSEGMAGQLQAARNLYARALQVRMQQLGSITNESTAFASWNAAVCASNLHGWSLVQVEPGNVRTYCALAALERKCGHLKAARLHLQTALGLEPRNPVALQVSGAFIVQQEQPHILHPLLGVSKRYKPMPDGDLQGSLRIGSLRFF